MRRAAGGKEDTSLGGTSRDFPRTTEGFVDQIVHASGPDRLAALEELCRRYWKPVYSFIRLAWARTNEDAKDLTQAFFEWLLQGDVLRKYQSERAPFRTFLKAILRRFVADQNRAEGRIKRGGQATLIPIEDGDLSLQDTLADSNSPDPEKAFDQAWMVALMKFAVEAVRRRFHSDGRAPQFQLFEEHDLASGIPPTSPELAERSGMTDVQVRNLLASVRRAVREEIRSELARQTRSREEFEEEWNALMGS